MSRQNEGFATGAGKEKSMNDQNRVLLRKGARQLNDGSRSGGRWIA